MTRQLTARLVERRDQLEMFAALYEAADSSFIESCVHKVQIENQALSSNDIYVISSMLLRCSEVQELRLAQCDLGKEAMDILNAGLKICKIKVKIRMILIYRDTTSNILFLLGFIGAINYCTRIDIFISQISGKMVYFAGQ